MIRGIVFDCFGVIRLDSIYPAYRALGGNPEADERFIWDTVNASNAGFIESSSPILAEKLGVTVDEWQRACEELAGKDPRVLSLIDELKKDYKIGLLTNVGKGGLTRWFEPDELERYFDVAIASGDVGYAKPEAQIYRLMVRQLGLQAEDCIMIDDRADYCDGARSIGMEAILYTDFDSFKPELNRILGSHIQQSANSK